MLSRIGKENEWMRTTYQNRIRKRNRRIRSALAVLLAVLSLTACGNRSTPEERVLSVFEEQKDTICEMIREYGLGDAVQWHELGEELDGVLRVHNMAVPGYDDGVLQFLCIAEGIAPAGFEAGFYYSPDDEPILIGWGLSPEPAELTEDGEGYSWTDGTDNSYYTERICEHFYYYQEVN